MTWIVITGHPEGALFIHQRALNCFGLRHASWNHMRASDGFLSPQCHTIVVVAQRT
jgi:hypothetical protein